MFLASTPSTVRQPSDEPLVGGESGTTIEPATPTGARWMWAAMAGPSRSSTVSLQQTSLWPMFTVMSAAPVPGEPLGGVSWAPVMCAMNGRPPWFELDSLSAEALLELPTTASTPASAARQSKLRLMIFLLLI